MCCVRKCCQVDPTAHKNWSIASKMPVLQQHWSRRWMHQLWAVAQPSQPAYVHPVASAGLTLQSLIKCIMVPLRLWSMARHWFSESASGNCLPQGCPECAEFKPDEPFCTCHLQKGSLGLNSAHSSDLIAFRWWTQTCRSAVLVLMSTPPCITLSTWPATFEMSSSAPNWSQWTVWAT